MSTTTVPTKRSLNPIYLFAFLAAVVGVWAGIDAGKNLISVLSVLVLVPATFQLFDKPEAAPSNALAALVRKSPRNAGAVQVVAGAVLMWLSIDTNVVLGIVAGGLLTVASAISLIKSGRKG
jgi:hypothetical protein